MDFRYNKTKCGARLRTTDGKITSSSGKHLHAPDGREILKKRALEQFKKDAITSTAARRSIVQTFCNNAVSKSAALSSVLPQVNSLLSTVNRLRVRSNIINPDPPSLSELNIPDAYKVTSTGEPFLLLDSGMFYCESDQNQFFILMQIRINFSF